MSYSKYFSNGQKVFLKRVFTEGEQSSLDTLTAYTTASQGMQLDLTLPYGSDAADDYPFEPGMPFEIMTDHRGMGLRLRAVFKERTSGKDIRLEFEGNLEFISRRMYRRVDVNAWIGYRHSKNALGQMRQAWQECLAKIEAGVNPKELTDFQKYPVNLAGGGLRMPLQAPIAPAELLLLFLSIGDKQGIICALAEIVWVGTPDLEGRQAAGLRFLNIREQDQQRIDKVVQGLIERLEQASKD